MVSFTEELSRDDASTPLAHTLRGLGPFDPPADFAFEPELRGPPPRLVPPDLKHGRIARLQRQRFVGGIVFGLFFVALGLLPRAGLFLDQTEKLTIVALAGLAVIGMSLVSFLTRGSRKGPLTYVEEGIPLVARVSSLVMRPRMTHNGQALFYEFAALVQLRDPASGQMSTWEMMSSEIPAASKDCYTTSYRVGDYATAVYLPSDPQGSLRLYGFLDLRPELGMLKEPRSKSERLGKLAQTIAAVVLIFAGLFWALYAVRNYFPLEMTIARIFASLAWGPLVFGLPVLWFVAREAEKRRRQTEERNVQAQASGQPLELEANSKSGLGTQGAWADAAVALGVLMIAGLTSFGLTLTANCVLDNSPPRPRAVVITNVGDSEVNFRFDGSKKTHTLVRMPAGLNQGGNNRGVALVRDGWLGWDWVETLEPLANAAKPKQAR